MTSMRKTWKSFFRSKCVKCCLAVMVQPCYGVCTKDTIKTTVCYATIVFVDCQYWPMQFSEMHCSARWVIHPRPTFVARLLFCSLFLISPNTPSLHNSFHEWRDTPHSLRFLIKCFDWLCFVLIHYLTSFCLCSLFPKFQEKLFTKLKGRKSSESFHFSGSPKTIAISGQYKWLSPPSRPFCMLPPSHQSALLVQKFS